MEGYILAITVTLHGDFCVTMFCFSINQSSSFKQNTFQKIFLNIWIRMVMRVCDIMTKEYAHVFTVFVIHYKDICDCNNVLFVFNFGTQHVLNIENMSCFLWFTDKLIVVTFEYITPLGKESMNWTNLISKISYCQKVKKALLVWKDCWLLQLLWKDQCRVLLKLHLYAH